VNITEQVTEISTNEDHTSELCLSCDM